MTYDLWRSLKGIINDTLYTVYLYDPTVYSAVQYSALRSTKQYYSRYCTVEYFTSYYK